MAKSKEKPEPEKVFKEFGELSADWLGQPTHAEESGQIQEPPTPPTQTKTQVEEICLEEKLKRLRVEIADHPGLCLHRFEPGKIRGVYDEEFFELGQLCLKPR